MKAWGLRGGRLFAAGLRAGPLPEARFRDAPDRARLDDGVVLPLVLRALRVLVATGGSPLDAAWDRSQK